MPWQERRRIRCAADHARTAIPGRIREYPYRDLMSIRECALRFDQRGLTARMIQAVLSINPEGV